jgi:hypothetical protein
LSPAADFQQRVFVESRQENAPQVEAVFAAERHLLRTEGADDDLFDGVVSEDAAQPAVLSGRGPGQVKATERAHALQRKAQVAGGIDDAQ